ncbi:MAG TPA: hypothetical protein VI248_05400 [Kineosporiaceae bacterium]
MPRLIRGLVRGPVRRAAPPSPGNHTPTAATRSRRRRVGAGAAAFALLVGAGLAATLGRSPAQAFNCRGALRCPFVKIENPVGKDPEGRYDRMVQYDASGTLVDASGATVHQWREKDPEFTLWHWRYYGDGSQIKVHIHSWSDVPALEFSADNDFTTPADKSLCIKIDKAGAYQASGCVDYEDPSR